MLPALTADQRTSLRKTYMNILALFLERPVIESRYLRCLLKWGFQLQVGPADLARNSDLSTITFVLPEARVERLETIYHLVYMIYLDQVVEDVELEVASIYAGKLGFESSVVSELFRSIATIANDSERPWNVRNEVLDFLKIYGA
ncbi:hypothetical protein QQ054_33730 [Oscillatoria amoena NRMC-F 0135]|nr:hypothetical protein [Oscillatoria amoena NRMC-F 0135]